MDELLMKFELYAGVITGPNLTIKNAPRELYDEAVKLLETEPLIEESFF